MILFFFFSYTPFQQSATSNWITFTYKCQLIWSPMRYFIFLHSFSFSLFSVEFYTMHQSLPCAFILIFYLFLFICPRKQKKIESCSSQSCSVSSPPKTIQEHYLNFIRYLSEICINSQLFCHSIYHRCTFHTHGWMMKNFDMSFKNKENGKVNKRHISYV